MIYKTVGKGLSAVFVFEGVNFRVKSHIACKILA